MNARVERPRDRENTIELAKRIRDRADDNARRIDVEESASRAARARRPMQNSDSTTSASPGLLPAEVLKRFIGIGAKYYFPDGAPAFQDRGTKLTTPSENAEVVRTLVSIAQLRGWDRIEVRGSERFRKEAWFAAGRVGLEVHGYNASDVEKAQLARSIARDRGSGRSGIEGSEPVEQSSIRPAAGPTRQHPASPRAGLNPAEAGVFVGRLLAHGAAQYQRDPSQQNSYFVRLETRNGERELWGVDFERALRQSLSAAKIGDEVTVRAASREAVSVPRKGLTPAGRPVGEELLETNRNRWVVERTDFLVARGRVAGVFRDDGVTPQEGVKSYPELQGSYLKLQAVKLGAERDIKDLRERGRVVARARALIAESIERGDPLEPVRLRDAVVREQPLRREPERSR